MTVLPGQEPVQKPHPARHAFGVVGIAFWVVFILSVFFAAAYYVSSVLTGGNVAAVISAVLVDLTNEDRKEEELGALVTNQLLTRAAQMKANDMAEKGYFAHQTPEGLQPWDFIREAGYAYSTAGENLAVNFTDSENVEEAWMNSPKHRANILNAKFTEIGIATAVGEYKGRKTTFVVQMFAAPRNDAVVSVPVSSVPENPEEPAITTLSPEPQILGSEEEVLVPPVASSEDAVHVSPQAGVVERLLTSPENLLRSLFLVSGLMVLIALALTTRLEFKRHHVPHVAAAALLLMLMGGTLMLADSVIFTALELGDATAAVFTGVSP